MRRLRWGGVATWVVSIGLLCSPSLGSAGAANEADPFPKAASAYLVSVDGQPVWQRKASVRLPMASLTKMMTALLVLESGAGSDAVRISATAAAETGSRAGLRRGERYSRDGLLQAMMVASANDACHALADFVAQNESAFVLRMNERARQMGLMDTRFANACGHDAPGHVSSAQDLLTLAKAVASQPALMAMASQRDGSLADLDGGRTLHFKNSNALIGRYAPAAGLKTGTTARAGRCLVAVARKNGHEVWLVMLHANDRWWDAVDIFELAFARAQAGP